MKKSMRANLPLLAGVTLAGAAMTGAAVAGTALAAAIVLRRSLGRQRTVDGKVVVITGGSRGLGFALAERFGRGGAKLVLAARDGGELARAAESLVASGAVAAPGHVLIFAGDLTDPAQAIALIGRARAHFGQVDVLLNNAGIIEVGPVEDQPLAAYTQAMQVNFFAALYTTQAALPGMLAEARRGSNEAAIVNIASVGGKVPVPHLLPYVASKFALVGFSEGLHAEVRHKGIRVTTVCPGLMRTGGEEHAHFRGDVAKERRWFLLSAKTPGLAASVSRAANRIFHAVLDGRAEITITPQAWLAARVVGIAPGMSQYVASLTNEYILPAPVASAPALPPAQAALPRE